MSPSRVSRAELEPWGIVEIAEALKLNRQTIYFHIGRGNFPAPWKELAMGRVWRSTDVLEWRRRQQAEGDPDAKAA